MDLNFVKSLGVPYENVQQGILNDYEFRTNVQDDTNPKYGYAIVHPTKGKFVEGVLMQIPETTLSLLDEYEGYPILYNRIQVKVYCPERSSYVSSWLYIGSDNFLTDNNLLLSEIQQLRIENGVPFLSKDYRESLLKVIYNR